MVDLSKAEPSRKFRNNYVAKYDRIVECIHRQKEEFLSYYDQCEVIRKERAAIIEGDLVKLLKSLDIKPSKPLGKFDNDGLIEELTRIINENPDKKTEEIEIAIIKIKNRYRDIINITKKMETYAQRIDNYPDEGYEANMEADYKDEIVIDLNAMKSQKKIETEKNDKDELEEVTGIHEASKETLDSLTDILEGYFGISNETSLDDTMDDELDYDSLLIGTDEEYVDENLEVSNQDEVTEKIDIPVLEQVEKEDSLVDLDQEEVNYAPFTINNNISFRDLIKHVYEEDDSEEYDSELWESVYNFSSNKDIIDQIAVNNNLTVEEVVNTPGLLKDITLRFPTELTTYEQTVSEGKSRAA